MATVRLVHSLYVSLFSNFITQSLERIFRFCYSVFINAVDRIASPSKSLPKKCPECQLLNLIGISEFIYHHSRAKLHRFFTLLTGAGDRNQSSVIRTSIVSFTSSTLVDNRTTPGTSVSDASHCDWG